MIGAKTVAVALLLHRFDERDKMEVQDQGFAGFFQKLAIYWEDRPLSGEMHATPARLAKTRKFFPVLLVFKNARTTKNKLILPAKPEEPLPMSNSPEYISFLQRVDPEMLGAIVILVLVFTFVVCVVGIVTVARTINSIVELRMNQKLVRDLLKQGYSVEDIERLAFGGPSIGRHLRGFVQSAQNRLGRLSRRHDFANRPVPPVKQSA